MQFLGLCEICQKPVRNYRALGQHLRRNLDAAHQDLHRRWDLWRSEYRATLYCLKCGQCWETLSKEDCHQRVCPKCRALKGSLSKRQYGKLVFDRAPDPRLVMSHDNSKAHWDGLKSRQVPVQSGDELYRDIVTSFISGESVRGCLHRMGVSYKLYRSVLEQEVGLGAYQDHTKAVKSEVASRNIRSAHRKWAAYTPEEKAQILKDRFGKGSQLEAVFSSEVSSHLGVVPELNVWQSLKINGKWCPREADLKLELGDGRKLVILCDGEAFHGPGYIFGNPTARIADDVQTAGAYYNSGYSVIRYSESEVHSGEALVHLRGALSRMAEVTQIYRTWYPLEERER
jgi:hypothetical protein